MGFKCIEKMHTLDAKRQFIASCIASYKISVIKSRGIEIVHMNAEIE